MDTTAYPKYITIQVLLSTINILPLKYYYLNKKETESLLKPQL